MRKLNPNPSLLSWFHNCKAEAIYISSLSLGEIHYGISLLPEGKKKTEIAQWFEQVVDAFSERILSVNVDTCVLWGSLRAKARQKGFDLPVIDGLLAATAKLHQMILVTRNINDVKETEIQLLNPWEANTEKTE